MVERTVTLSDGFITLRPPAMSDEQELVEAVRESIPNLKPWISWADENFNSQITHRWLQSLAQHWQEDRSYEFVIVDATSAAILGGCSLNGLVRHQRLANLGYWVRSSARGRGIAGRAVRLAAHFAFEHLNLGRVEIVVATANTASLRVAEKAGAHREGLLRNRIVVRDAVYDAVMHSLIPEDLVET